MEAKELQLGDWVKCLDSTHENKVFAQVDAIEEGQTCILVQKDVSNWFLDIEQLESIPLTAEILEKNGWNKELYSNESWDNEEIEALSLWIGEDGKNSWWWHVGVELVTPINYVHELQHALRLCGIEKEIVV